MSNEGAPLSFEEFIGQSPIPGAEDVYHPRFNNFPCRFINDDSIWGLIRKKGLEPYLTVFIHNHPKMDTSIQNKLSKIKSDGITCHPEIFPDLYQAYLVMRRYVADDEELFI